MTPTVTYIMNTRLDRAQLFERISGRPALADDEGGIDGLAGGEQAQELAAQARRRRRLAFVDDVARLPVGADDDRARLLRLDVDAEERDERRPAARHRHADRGAV